MRIGGQGSVQFLLTAISRLTLGCPWFQKARKTAWHFQNRTKLSFGIVFVAILSEMNEKIINLIPIFKPLKITALKSHCLVWTRQLKHLLYLLLKAENQAFQGRDFEFSYVYSKRVPLPQKLIGNREKSREWILYGYKNEWMSETRKKAPSIEVRLFLLLLYRKWDSNPHDFKGHWILSPARLPIPPFRCLVPGPQS